MHNTKTKGLLALLGALMVIPMASALSTTHDQTPGANAGGNNFYLDSSQWAPLGITNALDGLVIEPFGVSLGGVFVTEIVADPASPATGQCAIDGEVRANECGNDFSNQPWFRNVAEVAGTLVAGECEALIDYNPDGGGNYTGSTNVTTVADPGLFYPTYSMGWDLGLLSFADLNQPMELLEYSIATSAAAPSLGRAFASAFTYEGVGTATEVNFRVTLADDHNCDSYAATAAQTGNVARTSFDMDLTGPSEETVTWTI